MKNIFLISLILLASCASKRKTVYKDIYVPEDYKTNISKISEINFLLKHTESSELVANYRAEGNGMKYSYMLSKELGKKIKFLSSNNVSHSKSKNFETFVMRYQNNSAIYCYLGKDISLDSLADELAEKYSSHKNYKRHEANDVITYQNGTKAEFKELGIVMREKRYRYFSQYLMYKTDVDLKGSEMNSLICYRNGSGLRHTLRRVFEEFKNQI